MISTDLDFATAFDLEFEGQDLEWAGHRSKHGNFYADRILQRMAALRGFDGLPTLVDDLTRLSKHPTNFLYRGTTNQESIDDFQQGEYRPSFEPAFGSGFYFARDGKLNPWHVAMIYADGDESKVIRAALKPEARVIEINELGFAWEREKARLQALEPTRVKEALRISNRLLALSDLGRFAVYLGFDAILLEFRFQCEINVLNRSLLMVEV